MLEMIIGLFLLFFLVNVIYPLRRFGFTRWRAVVLVLGMGAVMGAIEQGSMTDEERAVAEQKQETERVAKELKREAKEKERALAKQKRKAEREAERVAKAEERALAKQKREAKEKERALAKQKRKAERETEREAERVAKAEERALAKQKREAKEKERALAKQKRKAERETEREAERVAKAEERALAKQKRKAEREAEREAERVAKAEEKRKGFHCLSSWDGSHRGVVKDVEDQLNDPDSFDHDETRVTPVSAEGTHTLSMKFRAKNAFGGLMRGQAVAVYQNEGCDHVLISCCN